MERFARWIVIATLAAGCGIGPFADESGGADNLPTQGAGPYRKPDVDFDTLADEPYVVADNRASLLDPAVLSRDDDGFSLWFGRELDNTENESEIWHAEIPGIFDLPDIAPEQSLTPDTASWEETRIARPDIVVLDDRLVMFYEGGVITPGIGRAESTDGGLTWQKSSSNPVLLDATEPAVAFVEGSWHLFVTRPGVDGIFHATSSDGLSWELGDTPVISPRPGPIGPFDTDGVSAPFVIVDRTPAGQLHWGMFFSGLNNDAVSAIGYAGSFDGDDWERFAGVDPVLQPTSPSEHGPAAILRTSAGFLFFHEERQSRQRIAVAVHP